MKIIHMSDLHIGYAKENLEKRFEKLVNKIIFKKKPAKDYVVVVTGDLVEFASDMNFAMAKHYLNYLKISGFNVLVVPGNHDYGNGILGLKENVEKFKKAFFDKKVTYPKVDIIGDTKFIGLDSMADELNWYDNLWANGELGKIQLQDLDEELNKESSKNCVIYLHHHPFAPKMFHELKDSPELGKIVQKHTAKIKAILFGHNHDGDVWNGEWNIKRCYDAGSATGKEDSVPKVRVIDLDNDPNNDYVL